MYHQTLCSFWKNLSGHFSRSPLNRSYGYASAGDRKNWLAEIFPEFCIPMKYSGQVNARAFGCIGNGMGILRYRYGISGIESVMKIKEIWSIVCWRCSE